MDWLPSVSDESTDRLAGVTACVARGREGARERFSEVAGTIVATTYAVTGHAAAQEDASSINDAMCGTGLGQLLSLALGAIMVYLIIKGGFRALMGADKMGSSKSEQQYEGKEQVLGGAKTMAVGAVGPAILASVLDIAGVSTLSCFSFNPAFVGLPARVVTALATLPV